MSCKTFCMLAAMIGIAWSVEAGEIVPAEIRCGVAYPLVVNASLPNDLNVLPVEPAAVTFAQDAQSIRITVDMTDADVLSESVSDQTQLQRTGDAVQILLSPENDTRLWEIFVDAANRKSCFFHWGPGRMFYPPATDAPPVAITAVSVKTAAGWKTDVTFPAAEVLRKQNLPADRVWRVMVVRYNFGRNLSRRDVSCFPQAVRVVSDPSRFGRIVPNK